MFRRKLVIGAGVAILAVMLLPAVAASAGGWGYGHLGRHLGRPIPGTAVVEVQNGPYGPVLAVGGAGASYDPTTSTGYPPGSDLYFATVDPPTYGSSFGHPYQAGCTTTVVSGTLFGAISCTGPETSPSDWPAFTTTGYPIAGPGVNERLLGAVWRSDLDAFQVTYAGHPLYLFDPVPGSDGGANFYETVLPIPPWNTAWFLVSPWGTPATGPASLGTESPQAGTTYSSDVLASTMLPNAFGPPIPGLPVSVYTLSGDGYDFSRCYDACAREFIPVYTVGAPSIGSGVNTSAVGVIHRWDGTEQVTYNGHPLYLYDQEASLPDKSPSAPFPIMLNGTAGNGEGVGAFGGTLSLVSP